jgi:hypothetical protein
LNERLCQKLSEFLFGNSKNLFTFAAAFEAKFRGKVGRKE